MVDENERMPTIMSIEIDKHGQLVGRLIKGSLTESGLCPKMAYALYLAMSETCIAYYKLLPLRETIGSTKCCSQL